jgi:alpha,alpha-trehalase
MLPFREDFESAHREFHTVEERESYYSELKAAAESGWDFSSRWFIQNATNKGEHLSVDYFHDVLT